MTINPDGTLLYSPNSGFVGIDTFDYAISDGFGGKAFATVTVTVKALNYGLAAYDDVVTTKESKAVVIDVLSNDSGGVGSSNMSVTLTSRPNNGQVTLNSDGTLWYIPNTGFTGIDTFDYKVSDGKSEETSNPCKPKKHIVQDGCGKTLVDPTLHWASPNYNGCQGPKFIDCVGNTTDEYDGPVPMVIHLHGEWLAVVSFYVFFTDFPKNCCLVADNSFDNNRWTH